MDPLQRLTGGQAIQTMLAAHGAKVMFGIGGFQLLPLYDALARSGNASPRHILVADERSGAFAADGFARVAGRPGLCDGTMGPGATNLVTGLVESFTAGLPVVALVGDSNRAHSWKNMTQETRQREVLSPVVKEFIAVERGERIPELVRRAFLMATSGRPGPVVLCVPENVAHGEWEYPAGAFQPHPAAEAIPAFRTRPEAAAVTRAAEMIRASRRPVVLVGGGIHLSGAHAEMAEFLESLGLPVAHTISGKGALACGHALNLGLFGRYDRTANEFIKSADLIIGLGFKFGEIATSRFSLIPAGARVVHIDVSPEELGKHQSIALGVWADARLALADLNAEIGSGAAGIKAGLSGYGAEIQARKKAWLEASLPRLRSDEAPLNMARVCHELSLAMPADGRVLADGGFAAHWAALLYDTPAAGRTFIANRGNASIGYGLPGGMGAQLAAGRAPVLALTGDGGLNMTLGDLETAVRERIPLRLLVVNNAATGYVKALQHSMYGRYQSSELREMNYAAIAREMGAQGLRVASPAELAPALKAALAENSLPTVIDVLTTRTPESMLPAVDARTRK